MAKGYPDFFGYSIFPQYGAPKIYEGSIAAQPANTWDDLVVINAKGRILSGYFGAYTVGDEANARFKLTVDADEWEMYSFEGMFRTSLVKGVNFPIQCTHYNDVAGLYRFSIQPELSFVTLFKIEAQSPPANTMDSGAVIFWSQVS